MIFKEIMRDMYKGYMFGVIMVHEIIDALFKKWLEWHTRG